MQKHSAEADLTQLVQVAHLALGLTLGQTLLGATL